MNKAAQSYWNEFWGDNLQPQTVSAFQFGDQPDKLAQLVKSGHKTATCSAEISYRKTSQTLPRRGYYGIVLNRLNEPVAIIKTVDVFLQRFEDVTEEFALAEGDGSLSAWKDIHDRYFKSEYKRLGVSFDPELLLVCERFECINNSHNSSLKK